MKMKKLLCLLALVPGLCFGSVHTVMVDDNGNQVSPSNGFATIVLNGSPLVNWTNCTVTNLLVSSNWAIWKASTNVDMSSFSLTNATTLSGFFLTGTTGTFTTVDSATENITTANIKFDNITTANVSVANISLINSSTSTLATIQNATITTATVAYLRSATTNLYVQNATIVLPDPNVASSLTISNATYYGTEGDIGLLFKGYIVSGGISNLISSAGIQQIQLTNGTIVANSSGKLTNDYWTPGTAHSNVYYVDANFSSRVYPTSGSNYINWWGMSVVTNNSSTTNITWGDVSVLIGAYVSYGSANHIVKMHGDDRLGFFISSSLDGGAMLNYSIDEVNVDINVIATH